MFNISSPPDTPCFVSSQYENTFHAWGNFLARMKEFYMVTNALRIVSTAILTLLAKNYPDFLILLSEITIFHAWNKPKLLEKQLF